MADLARADIELLADCGPDEVAELARRLTERRLDDGAVLMAEGDPGSFFALVTGGLLVVERGSGTARREVAVVGPGSLVGELALLLDAPRGATIRAAGPAAVAVGGVDDLELLVGLTGVHDRIEALASRRLAESARPVRVALPRGGTVTLRPLLPADRAAYASAIGALSADSLRRRFLSGGRPSSRMIDYLVDIDYVDHFAWVVLDDDGDRVLATVRFVRLRADPDRAEVAFEVADDHQGRGVATVLLGAIGVAATSAAVDRLVATVLVDNAPMRAVFAKAGAVVAFGDPGEVRVELAPAAAAALLADEDRDEVARAVGDIVTAAGLALTREPPG